MLKASRFSNKKIWRKKTHYMYFVYYVDLWLSWLLLRGTASGWDVMQAKVITPILSLLPLSLDFWLDRFWMTLVMIFYLSVLKVNYQEKWRWLWSIHNKYIFCCWKFWIPYIRLFTRHIFPAISTLKPCIKSTRRNISRNSCESFNLIDLQGCIKFTRMHFSRLWYSREHRGKWMHAVKTWYKVVWVLTICKWL